MSRPFRVSAYIFNKAERHTLRLAGIRRGHGSGFPVQFNGGRIDFLACINIVTTALPHLRNWILVDASVDAEVCAHLLALQ